MIIISCLSQRINITDHIDEPLRYDCDFEDSSGVVVRDFNEDRLSEGGICRGLT